MKNIKKKIATFMLALMFVLQVSPFELLANYQNPVIDLTLTDFSPTDYNQRGQYSLNFRFKQPQLSKRIDPSAIDGTTEHVPMGYELYWRNITARETYDEARKTNYPAAGLTSPINITVSPTFEPGSIYMYKMVPWHMHEYRNPAYTPTNGLPPTITMRAPIDGENLTKEDLYLTDIRITARATTEEIYVEWDNPTFLGNDLFTSYKFYYAGGGQTANLTDTSSSFEVSVKDPALHRDAANNKLSYTFPNPGNIVVGTQYAMKVVPLYNGRRVTEGNLVVTVGTNQYSITSTNREYRTNEVNVNPALEIFREGKDYLKLQWSSYLSSLIDIDSIVIYKSDTKDFTNATNLGTISGTTAKQVNFFLVDRPTNTTYYKAVIYYRVNDSSPPVPLETMVAVYNPAYEAFNPTKPSILEVSDYDDPPFGLDITWEAFVRRAYTEDEKGLIFNSYGEIVDKGVLYDIYVTDDISNFDASKGAFLTNKIVDSLPANMLNEFMFKYTVGQDVIDKPAYKYSVNQYVTMENGQYVRKNIVDNKIYYIMIIAKRDPSGETSARAYYSHYYEPKGPIPSRPIMMAKPPLRIKKDKEGIEVIAKDSITIEWETTWYEVYNDADGTWYSKLGVDENGKILFGKSADQLPKNKVIELNGSIYNNSPDPLAAFPNIYNDLSKLGIVTPELMPLRFMDLGDARYEINVTDYEYMETSGGYDAYVKDLAEKDWETISPVARGSVLEFPVNHQTTPQQMPLEPNTAYTILIRPYKILADGKKEAYFPNYIIATTLSDRPPLDITPTVPIIEAVGSTDTTVTVRFEYMEGLKYQLFWNELMPNYPEKGILIDNDALKTNGKIEVDNGKTYMVYTIPRLFPNTIYHVWVRSYSDNTGTTVYSDYSNPVSITTKDMEAPQPPDGLGLVSKNDLDIYNKENQTSWLPVDYNYMIIQWFRDLNDKNTVEAPGAPPAGGAGGDKAAAEVLSSPNILDTFIVKYNELIGNKGYYIRAKTVLTITKNADGGIDSYYQYVVQMSPEITFTDFVEITVPSEIGATDPVYTITKQSPWTRTIRLVTKPYTGEYDGDKWPDTYPLPEQDFELLYEQRSDTLTYRYRSDQIDADGNKDNRVDQRFISMLIAKNIFNVYVDLSAYEGRLVKNSIVEIPYSIVRTFTERKISFTLIQNDTAFTFSPGFIETPQVKALHDLGDMCKIKIGLSAAITGIPNISPDDFYATTPKKLDISVLTPTKTVNLTSLANLYTVELRLGNRYLTMDKNTGAYIYTSNDTGWARVPNESYQKETGQITISLQKLASYATIAKPLPKDTSGNLDSPIYTVASLIDITDMKAINPNAKVTASQLNKLMAAIAEGRKSVALNAALTDAELNALARSGLGISGVGVTREVGLNSLIKLYEMKTKSTVKNYAGLAQTPYKDIQTASPQYQTALLKAADLGFFGNAKSALPKSDMTFGDMLKMADFIIQDAGL